VNLVAATASKELKLLARPLGQNINLDLTVSSANDTVGHLKASIAAKLRLTGIDRVRIIHADRELDKDWQVLSAIGITKGTIVSFMLSDPTTSPAATCTDFGSHFNSHGATATNLHTREITRHGFCSTTISG